MDLACGCSLPTTHDLKYEQINYRYEARLKTLINAMQFWQITVNSISING